MREVESRVVSRESSVVSGECRAYCKGWAAGSGNLPDAVVFYRCFPVFYEGRNLQLDHSFPLPPSTGSGLRGRIQEK